jgi:Holliday junction DNA helicase RuvA
MIRGLRGRVRAKEAGSLLVTVGPVDVRVAVSALMASRVLPDQEVDLRTHLHAHEDQFTLYGFSSQEELETFELLLTVSGVGPKMALGILSLLAPGQVSRAIVDGEWETLTRAPGVGPRAARRIVTDLQGKVTAQEPGAPSQAAELSTAALAALVSMGYSATEARQALQNVAGRESVEDLLVAALGVLADR